MSKLALETEDKHLLVGTKVKPSCLVGGWSVGSTPNLHYVPWQLPYNWGTIMEKPQWEHL